MRKPNRTGQLENLRRPPTISLHNRVAEVAFYGPMTPYGCAIDGPLLEAQLVKCKALAVVFDTRAAVCCMTAEQVALTIVGTRLPGAFIATGDAFDIYREFASVMCKKGILRATFADCVQAREWAWQRGLALELHRRYPNERKTIPDGMASNMPW